MSTRRLITLALACGLAILVAGGVWLVLASREQATVPVLAVGASASVGPLTVTLVKADVATDATISLDVEMQAVEEDVEDPAAGWAVLSNRGPERVDRQEAGSTPGACPAGTLARGSTLRCTVTFDATPEQVSAGLQALYLRESDRAVWPLPARP